MEILFETELNKWCERNGFLLKSQSDKIQCSVCKAYYHFHKDFNFHLFQNSTKCLA